MLNVWQTSPAVNGTCCGSLSLVHCALFILSSLPPPLFLTLPLPPPLLPSPPLPPQVPVLPMLLFKVDSVQPKTWLGLEQEERRAEEEEGEGEGRVGAGPLMMSFNLQTVTLKRKL